ncbi:hypothetical protein [Ignavibacterium sp.]|uniref:hypothetical protein n=1 Tax=Ignavibacterium sp. TaxID=2651167 RepID=UPI00307D92AC
MKISNKLIEDYRSKKITRAQLSKLTGLDGENIYGILWKRNIKIWDLKRKTLNEVNFERDIELYKKRKLTREDIATRHNIKLVSVNGRLYKKKIEFWDKRKKKTKTQTSKYFNWRELKNNIMSCYNK